jgi:DNA-formamidopyrimidine glycosylase
MPEGPEIKLATDFLNKYLENKSITKFEILDGKYLKKPLENFELIEQDITIEKVLCKGKFIYFKLLNSDVTIWNTFGLTGNWSLIKNKYAKIKVTNEDNKILYYNDKLNFGTLKISTSGSDLKKKLNSLGLDILDHNINSSDYLKKIRNKTKKNDKEIGLLLMDQKLTAGCGNYIRADVLYLSKVNPFKMSRDLSDKDIELIWNNLQKVAFFNYDEKEGIKNKVFEFNELLEIAQAHIYNRECDAYNNEIQKKKLKDRTVHWCPNIQI